MLRQLLVGTLEIEKMAARVAHGRPPFQLTVESAKQARRGRAPDSRISARSRSNGQGANHVFDRAHREQLLLSATSTR